MAATAAQVLANQENAKKSTGPRTQEGRKRSSQNACSHNLTGGPALAPDEDPAAYQAHLDKFQDDYEPDGDTETFIVRQIADAVWRLLRCSRMEEELMAYSSNPFAEEDDKVLRRLERLQRYRKSIESTGHCPGHPGNCAIDHRCRELLCLPPDSVTAVGAPVTIGGGNRAIVADPCFVASATLVAISVMACGVTTVVGGCV